MKEMNKMMIVSARLEDKLFNESLDMEELLGIDIVDDSIENEIFGESLVEYHPFYDRTYWDLDGNSTNNLQSFPEESPVGKLFIDGYDQFKDICLFEINFEEIDNTSVYDSNGNGIKGILIGDFSVEKENVDQPAVRDSYMKVPKFGKKDGAF